MYYSAVDDYNTYDPAEYGKTKDRVEELRGSIERIEGTSPDGKEPEGSVLEELEKHNEIAVKRNMTKTREAVTEQLWEITR